MVWLKALDFNVQPPFLFTQPKREIFELDYIMNVFALIISKIGVWDKKNRGIKFVRPPTPPPQFIK